MLGQARRMRRFTDLKFFLLIPAFYLIFILPDQLIDEERDRESLQCSVCKTNKDKKWYYNETHNNLLNEFTTQAECRDHRLENKICFSD